MMAICVRFLRLCDCNMTVTISINRWLMLSNLEDNAKTLSDFGLTNNQAKVYLSVVQLGLASIGRISKFSKVRREEVYRLLPELEKAGLVERVLGTPIKVRAMPVEDALSILINREEEKAKRRISTLTAMKEQFLKSFKTGGKIMELEEEGAQFVLILEKDAVVSRNTSMIRNAKRGIDIVESREKLVQFISTYAEPLKRVVKRGVKVRIITELPSDEDAIPVAIEKYVPRNSFDLRYVDALPSYYVVVDNKEAMVNTGRTLLENSHSLWTSNDSLVGLMQRNFEDLFHASIHWANVGRSPSEKLMRLVSQLKPTEHAIFVYDSLEAKHNFLFSYIRCGLENGEAAVYVCSEESPSQIRDAMKRFGIEVEEHERIGALNVLPYTDVYIVNGRFSIPSTIGLWNRFYKEALAKGFRGLRVTGETACFFEHNLIRELVEYEEALHRVLEIPIVGVCAYNANMFRRTEGAVNLYNVLARAHSTVLFTGMDSKLGRMEILKT